MFKRVLGFIFFPVTWVVRGVSNWIASNFIGLIFVSILLVLSVVVLWKRVVIVIPAGSVGVIYRPLLGGIDMDRILNEGLNLVFPLNTVTEYDSRVQMKQIQMEVLTKDQLRSDIKVSFQFQINKYALPLLHKFVGPDYVTKVILPEVTGKTRVMFAELTSQEAFTKQLERIVNEIAIMSDQVILEKLGPPGLDYVRLVRITAVQLESMEFPAEIQAAIRSKIAEAQAAEAYVFKVQAARLEAERKEVEAGGIKKYQDIVNAGLTDNYLKIRGIEATLKLAESNNSKVVIFGSSPNGLPIVLSGDSASPTPTPVPTSGPAPSSAPTGGPANGGPPGPGGRPPGNAGGPPNAAAQGRPGMAGPAGSGPPGGAAPSGGPPPNSAPNGAAPPSGQSAGGSPNGAASSGGQPAGGPSNGGAGQAPAPGQK
jgi:regulator of protease activity HflC (stomatin/prohibitin superfamily)